MDIADELPAPQQRTPESLGDLLELQGVEVTEGELKKLRKQILEKGHELGVELIYRPRNGGPYRLRVTALKEHMPELWGATNLREPVIQFFKRLETDIQDIDRDIHELCNLRLEVAELRARDDILADEIAAIKKQLRGSTANGRHVSTISEGQDSKSQPT